MHAPLRITSFVLTWACVGCVGAPPPPPGGGDGSSSTTTSASDTTGPPPVTTAPADTSGTGGATGTSGSTTTVGVSVTDDGTTSVDPSTSSSTSSSGESSSSGEPPPPECVVPGDCPNNETCNVMGECESVCAGPGWGVGDYSYCVTPLGGFNSAVICGEALSCIISGSPIEAAVCGRSCASQCDCPAPPGSGNATVTCGNLFDDGVNECYLSCASGETCPDGMVCRTDIMGNPLFCSHPVQPIEVYGNCDNFAAGCVAGAECSTSGSNSICTGLCPGGSPVECEAALPGAALGVACGTVISPPAGNDCYMPCANTPDCPAGMQCINDSGDLLCMWP